MPEAMNSLWSKKTDPRKGFSLQLGFLAFSLFASSQQCVSSHLADALPLPVATAANTGYQVL